MSKSLLEEFDPRNAPKSFLEGENHLSLNSLALAGKQKDNRVECSSVNYCSSNNYVMNNELDSRANPINIEYIRFDQENSPSLLRLKAESINLETDCQDPDEPNHH